MSDEWEYTAAGIPIDPLGEDREYTDEEYAQAGEKVRALHEQAMKNPAYRKAYERTKAEIDEHQRARKEGDGTDR